MSEGGSLRIERWRCLMQLPRRVPSLAMAWNDRAFYGDVESLALLLRCGMGLRQPDMVWHVVASRREGALAALLGAGLSPALRDSEGTTWLMMASCFFLQSGVRRETLIDAALQHGVDMEAVDFSGRTALMLAAAHDRTDAIDYLLDRGAHIDARDPFGQNALMWASMNNSPKAIHTLVARGGDLEARNHVGMTALLLAAKNAKKNSLRALLKSGASPRAVNNFGQSVRECCNIKEILDIVEQFVTANPSNASHPAGGVPTP